MVLQSAWYNVDTHGYIWRIKKPQKLGQNWWFGNFWSFVDTKNGGGGGIEYLWFIVIKAVVYK